ncbi:MAG TPA: RsmG family class I SAM-dependent methyltransferase [Polyangiaceae bacterium]|nr:RsmG family class I SAM-dependent methyltransferase [Polyangiaceae bacterium]
MALEPLGPGWSARVERVLSELGRDEVGTAAVERLCALLDLVVTWNARMDLTAARSADELVELFLADAAVIAQARSTSLVLDETWIDVGSGAGAPALPLAILLPHLDLTLIEPRQRRVAFLRSAIGQLQCARVRVERARSEDLEGRNHAVAVSRATLPPELWLAEGARLAQRAVWVLIAKADAPHLPDWQVVEERRYRWPFSGAERRALCFMPVPG